MGYDGTIEYLYALQKHGIKLGLDNPRELMRRAGHPERVFRSVHVAGTNGKGSTSAALASMLRAAGHKTGLFTSPHLVSFTERIKVDGVEITRDEVVRLAEEARALSEGLTPTFFEIVTLIGFLHFQRTGVEWAVVETGMGGRLDATNVLDPAVTVITPIGLDHREFLGETLREIAGEKAGIIKPGVPVIVGRQEPDAMAVLEAQAKERGAAIHLIGREFSAGRAGRVSPSGIRFDYASRGREFKGIAFPLSGLYQADNAALAIAALEAALPAHGDMERIIREGCASTKWPGRLDHVAGNPPTYIDGAHNPPAARALAGEIAASGMLGKFTLVLGAMADKDVAGILAPLVPLASEVIFTAPAYGRAASAEALIETARRLSPDTLMRTVPGVAEALRTARALRRPVLVTGSFYTIGEAMESLGKSGFLGTLRECVKPSS